MLSFSYQTLYSIYNILHNICYTLNMTYCLHYVLCKFVLCILYSNIYTYKYLHLTFRFYYMLHKIFYPVVPYGVVLYDILICNNMPYYVISSYILKIYIMRYISCITYCILCAICCILCTICDVLLLCLMYISCTIYNVLYNVTCVLCFIRSYKYDIVPCIYNILPCYMITYYIVLYVSPIYMYPAVVRGPLFGCPYSKCPTIWGLFGAAFHVALSFYLSVYLSAYLPICICMCVHVQWSECMYAKLNLSLSLSVFLFIYVKTMHKKK